MSTAPLAPAGPAVTRPRRHVWRWVFGLAALCVFALLVTVVNAVTLTRDAALLRNEVVKAAGLNHALQVQVTAGPVLLTAARLGLSFVPDLPPEARLAIKAVRSASVGVYTLNEAPSSEARRQLLTAIDAPMARRGWVRLVGVLDNQETVLVYAPTDSDGRGVVPICVAVLNDRELVVVSGRVEGAPLVELVGRQRPHLALY